MKALNELNLQEVLDGLKGSKFTSVEVTKACLKQIEKYDSKLKAYITVVGESALQDAKAADLLIKKEGTSIFLSKPLLGVPYCTKDNYSTKGIETTAGSNILKGYIPPYESTVTARLKDAGAILLGKTNLDAFAHGSSTMESDFFTTSNPWDISRVPGGSSGGSAVAVAAHMCIFAIGSDTGGSIRCPASWCGITGLKPTYGRVSRYGVIAMASSTDSPGPMTKTVWDSAKVLEVIAGVDINDATSSPEAVEDYTTLIKEFNLTGLKGLKVGVPKSYIDMDLEPSIKSEFLKTIELIKSFGAEIIDIELLSPKYSIAVYTILQRSEVSSNLACFDGIRFGHGRDSFGFEAKKRMMLGSYSLSSGYYDEFYSKAQKVRTLIIEDFNTAFDSVDIIIGPTLASPPVKIGAEDEFGIFGELIDALQEPGSIAGLPVITIPGGFADGFPVGFQIIGPQLKESLVLGAAYSFQDQTDFHNNFANLEETTK